MEFFTLTSYNFWTSTLILKLGATICYHHSLESLTIWDNFWSNLIPIQSNDHNKSVIEWNRKTLIENLNPSSNLKEKEKEKTIDILKTKTKTNTILIHLKPPNLQLWYILLLALPWGKRPRGGHTIGQILATNQNWAHMCCDSMALVTCTSSRVHI